MDFPHKFDARRSGSAILWVASLLLISCAPDDSSENELNDTDASSDRVNSSRAGGEVDDSDLSSDEHIREFGKIIAIEDGGYPSFSVDVEFPERQFTQSFYLNVEATPLEVSQLEDLIGKFATVHYTSDLENSLMDMQTDGKSLFGDDTPDSDPEFRTAEGILSGADNPTCGDLPDEITIEPDEGEKLIFEFFITEEMVAQNGKRVTVTYDRRPMHRILDIQPSKD